MNIDHRSTIENRNQLWQAYFSRLAQNDAIRANAFKVVDSEGKIVNQASTVADAVRLVNNAEQTVRHEDYLSIQQTLTEVRRDETYAFNDLSGLTFSENISSQIVMFERRGEFGEAKQEMNPTITDNDDAGFDKEYLPCPVTHKGFSVPWRQNAFDYKRAFGIEESARVIMRKNEKTLWFGNPDIKVNVGGSISQIYGYTTHPNRSTAEIANLAADGAQALIHTTLNKQFKLMRQEQGSMANKSCIVYFANDIWSNLFEDYKAESDRTAFMRSMDIGEIKDIKRSEHLADSDVLIVHLDRQTIEVCMQSDLIAVPHMQISPFGGQQFTSYDAKVACIKSDIKGTTGIRHLSKA